MSYYNICVGDSLIKKYLPFGSNVELKLQLLMWIIHVISSNNLKRFCVREKLLLSSNGISKINSHIKQNIFAKLSFLYLKLKEKVISFISIFPVICIHMYTFKILYFEGKYYTGRMTLQAEK